MSISTHIDAQPMKRSAKWTLWRWWQAMVGEQFRRLAMKAQASKSDHKARREYDADQWNHD
ncbi:hypothetical protein O9992_24235 [Vibrio lentus]|nr:hypothetical protein [Vibrio lentus]